MENEKNQPQEAENYFSNNEPSMTMFVKLSDFVKDKGVPLGEGIKKALESEQNSLFKAVLTQLSVISSNDNELTIDSILEWKFGPCGSCYNSTWYYAWAYRPNSNTAWQYGCGNCT